MSLPPGNSQEVTAHHISLVKGILDLIAAAGGAEIQSTTSNPFFCAGVFDADGAVLSSKGRVGFTVNRVDAGVFDVAFSQAYGSSDYILVMSSNQKN